MKSALWMVAICFFVNAVEAGVTSVSPSPLPETPGIEVGFKVYNNYQDGSTWITFGGEVRRIKVYDNDPDGLMLFDFSLNSNGKAYRQANVFYRPLPADMPSVKSISLIHPSGQLYGTTNCTSASDCNVFTNLAMDPSGWVSKGTIAQSGLAWVSPALGVWKVNLVFKDGSKKTIRVKFVEPTNWP